MTTDWKHTLKHIAIAAGKGLLFLARHLWALWTLTGRFLALRAIPALWRWLRGTLFPGLRRACLRLPHRRIVAASSLGAIVIAIAVLLLRMPDHTQPTGGNTMAHDDASTPASATPVVDANGLTPLPHGTWTDLANRLVEAKNLATATRVTREVLARGGMATTDGKRVLVTAIGPATPYRVAALEARNLAMEARHRASAFRLHGSEFAQFLNGFGWELGNASWQTDAPSWMTDEEFKALDQEAFAKVAAAEQAALAGGAAGALVLQQRLPSLEAAAAKALAELEAARAAINTVPLAERAPLHARMRELRSVSRDAHAELRMARDATRNTTRDRTFRANQAREAAHREFIASRSIGHNHRAGAALLEFLDTWVRKAAEHPNDPESFTPLFLAEMARHQDTPFDMLGSEYVRPTRAPGVPVDLRGGPRSEQYRMTLLEMQLFLAAFQRGMPTTDMRPPASSRLVSGIANLLLPTAHASGTNLCGDVKEILGGSNPRDTSLTDWAVNQGASDAFDALTGLGGDIGKMLSGINSAAKILRVVVQFANTEVQVRALQGMVHKPPGDSGSEGHGTRFVRFTATAGVDPDELEAYDRALRDEEMHSREIFSRCVGELGLPALQSLREIADAAEKWRVQWEIRPLFPDHMTIPMRDPENPFLKQNSVNREMQLKRVSDASAEATIKAQVWRERATRGDTAVAYNEVIAKVVDTGTPGMGELVNSVKAIFGLGMKDIVLDLATGWMKHILVPRAAAVQQIEYHCLQVQRHYRSDGEVRAIGNGTGETSRARENCLLPETAK